jgi:hypothetical protein
MNLLSSRWVSIRAPHLNLLVISSPFPQEQIATAQKGLRGKDKNAKFVIDKDGKLITIDPVRPEGLPPFAVPLATAIGDGNDDDDAKRRKGKGKKSVRVVGSPSALVEGRYFTPANTLAATLAGGEKITDINPGVTIQAGDSTRAGPEAVSPPGKTVRDFVFPLPSHPLVVSSCLHPSFHILFMFMGQSRKEYLRGGNTGSAILDASYADSPGGASPGVHFALEGESIASLGDRAASPSLLSAPGTASMRMPDIDVFEGSRRVAPVDVLDAEEEDEAVAEVDAGGSRTDLRYQRMCDRDEWGRLEEAPLISICLFSSPVFSSVWWPTACRSSPARGSRPTWPCCMAAPPSPATATVSPQSPPCPRRNGRNSRRP